MATTTRPLLRSFAGGEITPELYGRLDLDKFQTGLARSENFLVLPHGPITARPGFAYVLEAKGSEDVSRLIPFSFSADQTMVLEFGHHYIRFHTAGATLLESAKSITSITQASPGVFTKAAHGYSTGDTLFTVGIGGMSVLNYRFWRVTVLTANTYTLTDLDGVALNTSALPAYTGGGSTARVYEVATTYDSADLFDLHYAQSADVLTITHPGYPTRELRRLGATNWQIADVVFGASVGAPSAAFAVSGGPGGGTPTNHVYVCTATSGATFEESLASPASAAVTIDLSVAGNYVDITPGAVSGAVRYTIYKLDTGGLYGYIGQSDGSAFRDDNINPDMSQTPPLPSNPFPVPGLLVSVPVTAGGTGYGTALTGKITAVTVAAGGTGYASPTLSVSDPTGSGATFSVTADANPPNAILSVSVLTQGSGYTDPTFTLTDSSGSGARLNPTLTNDASAVATLGVTGDGTGAEVEPVISGGVITAVSIINPGSGYTTATVTVTNAAGGSGATFGPGVIDSTNNYPSTVTYIEQRRCFAATDSEPQKVWATRSATESNMSQSIPVRDDDAIIINLKATQQNRVRHLVPLNDLIALTAGSEVRIYAPNSDALTPASATPKTQSYVGASNVQPAVAENSILYAQAQGGHIREFAYAGSGIDGAIYQSNDISILAPHLVDGYSITDMAFSRTSACPVLWCVRSDGVLLGMTYVPGQNVRAWHQHSTTGAFESVCCVSESGEDVLYAVVRRAMRGRTVRAVERLHTRQFTAAADAFHVDCGATYDGSATATITQLWHLEGQTVTAVADGAVWSGLVVSGGQITLPAAASVVHVGLPYACTAETLPLSWQADGFGQGSMKNVSGAHFRVRSSGAFWCGPTGGTLYEVPRRSTETYGAAPRLKTGWDHITVAPKWQDDGGITIEHRYALPLTVLSLVLDVTSS